MKLSKTTRILPAAALLLAMLFAFAACGKTETAPQNGAAPDAADGAAAPPEEDAAGNEPSESVPVNFGVLKGPTGMGAVFLLEDIEEKGYDYNVTIGAAPTEFTSLLINGELDIAAIPTNVAATLYNKTKGGVKLLMLNTKGVLYILENGDSVQSVSDLAGRTIYATGQVANPEYVLNYILRENSLEPGVDVTIEWRDSDELATLMASGEIDLCMLPVPAATSVTVKNSGVRYALDLTKEWDALNTGSELIMGCVAVRTEFYEEHPQAVREFLERYYHSVAGVMEFMLPYGESNVDIGELLAKHEIVGSAAIGNAALPYSNLCHIYGPDMKAAIQGYFEVLYGSDPSSIGGAVPGDDFYCDTGFEAK
ncbi:MAG: ABC transporter substrate-binding protein [Oscillospiraceae bacterium]|jgi:NitT/TauT family transport system substrate-binding protein